MLFGDKLPLPKFGIQTAVDDSRPRGGWGSFLLGILFALTFCPTSGLFYFGMLIPMSALESSGAYLLPPVYALATGLPVVLAAWILAYSVAQIGRFYHQAQRFQRWFGRIVAIVFIFTGIYYGLINLNII